MRVSADRSDPGFDAYCDFITQHGGVRIFCNGREVHNVVTADDQAGFVLCLQTDEHGHAIIKDDELATTVLRGVITFIKGPPSPRPKAPVDFLAINKEFSNR